LFFVGWKNRHSKNQSIDPKVLEIIGKNDSRESVLNLVNEVDENLNSIVNGTVLTTEQEKHLQKFPKITIQSKVLAIDQKIKQAEVAAKNRAIEDEQRRWVSDGMAKFAEILQNANDIEQLADNALHGLIKYLNINQGGLFLIEEENDAKYLVLKSMYAYNRKKYANKRFEIHEGLTGMCILEKQSIYMTDIPNNYIEITSGLGDAPPGCLLIVPLKFDDEILGVMELASFHELQKYEIEFTEKVAENISGTIRNTLIGVRTRALLEQSQQKTEELQAQEEEMRQNIEELQATQEEAARREAEMEGQLEAINQNNIMFEMNISGRIDSLNDNLCTLLQYHKPDLMSTKYDELRHVNDTNSFDEIFNGLQSSRKFVAYPVWKDKEENEVFISGTFAPIMNKNGEIVKILFIGYDISSVRKLELETQKLAEEVNEQKELVEFTKEEMEATRDQYDMMFDEMEDKEKGYVKKIEELEKKQLV